MMASIGIPGLILILVLALVLFGPQKLPEIGRAVGQSLKEFKKSTKEIMSDEKEYVTEIEKSVVEKKQ